MLAKLALVSFGSVIGLLLLVVTFQILRPAAQGTEFDSIADVRKAMLSESQGADSQNTNLQRTSPEAGNVSLKGIVQPDPDDRIIYTLKPKLDLRFIRARVQTNSCGMRGPEVSVLKPAKTFRVALLGDSFAFGWGVEQSESFAQILENELTRLAPPGLKVQVLNFGVPGYSTFQEVALFKSRGLEFLPDAVLLYFVQNDFGMPFFIRNIEGGDGLLNSLEFVKLGKRLFSGPEMNSKIAQMGLDPNRAISDLNALARENGIPLYVALNPHKKWRSDLKRLWSLERQPDIRQIPLRDPLMRLITDRGIAEEDLTLSFDPHPSPIRHKMLGELLASRMQEIFRD